MIDMEMNVGLLKELIKDYPDDMPVFVGCQGYTNYDSLPDTDTFLIEHKGKLFVTDECGYDIDGEDL